MYKELACLAFISFFFHHALSQECTATVIAVEQPGQWEEHGVPKRIFNLHITNTHSSCTIGDSLTVDINLLHPGSKLGTVWGLSSSGVAAVDSLSPGQTYSGAGFTLLGRGTPKVTVLAIQKCDCSTSPPTESPSNPTSTPSDPTSTPIDPTSNPTTTPTSNPTTEAPTTPPTNPTNAPTLPPNTDSVSLKYLVLSANLKADGGLDLVNLTFDAVGTQYDVVTVSASTSLDSYLSTSGAGKYAGIVSIKKGLLSTAQQQSITNYQLHYGVRWVILESSPSGLTGVSAGTAISAKGTLTLAPEFIQYSHPLQQSVSVDTQHSIAWEDASAVSFTPAKITDSSIVTPAIVYNGDKVAVAAFKLADGTEQLHYFIPQSTKYFFSRVFSVLMLNWLSPAGIYLGLRRVTLAVQPDDLFMSSFLWDTTTHSNPLSQDLQYRITADDLQKSADFLVNTNPTLPQGSYVTIEWPYNGAASTWYTQPDPLLLKAVEVQDTFYFVSHTWDHPCTFDTATYEVVFNELKDNIDWTNTGGFLKGNMASPVLSNESLVNPCITGLFNGNCLKAMADNGIKYAVGDNSVDKLIPKNKYHGITTTVDVHGYAGIFIIPREAYNIDYDNSLPAELIDQFNVENSLTWNFEQIMQLQVDYAMEKKTGFRHDAYMFHQANVRFFSYDDPVAGKTHDVSLTTLWMDRVIKKTLEYYDLPIVSPKFPVMAKIWQDREALDNCGLNTEFLISNGQVVGIKLASTNSCEVPLSGIELSGSNIRTEHAGSEVTSFISMTAGVSQTIAFPSPIKF